MPDPQPSTAPKDVETSDVEKLWTLIGRFGACMFATSDDGVIRSRPMRPTVRREENAIYFLTDARSHKIEEIEGDHTATLIFSDAVGNTFASVHGEARVLDDRALVRALWTPADAAWWEGVEDPNVRALEITPIDGQFWDGPNWVAGALIRTAAAAVGAHPDLGEARKVEMPKPS